MLVELTFGIFPEVDMVLQQFIFEREGREREKETKKKREREQERERERERERDSLKSGPSLCAFKIK